MNKSRIVISTPRELDSPHFDDEATIVTARPVIPIAEAKAVERSRMTVLIVAGLAAAAIAGAAGALGINFYQNRHPASASAATQPQANQRIQTDQSAQPTTETGMPAAQQSPAPITAAEPVSPATDGATTETQALSADQMANSSAGKAELDQRDESSVDPSRVVRKRRVHAMRERATSLTPPNRLPRRPRGAGRIIEIFEGPQ